MKQYKLLNNLTGWFTFIVAAVVYTLTLEPTASFWDCPEFISSAFKLEVGHPPGNPFFMLFGNFFTWFASDTSKVAVMVNFMSGLFSAGTILMLCWSITHLAKKIVCEDENKMTTGQLIAILGSGLVGALVYTFTDTFWFSAVEGEVYGFSSFCTAIVFWLILKWENISEEAHADRYIILIAYLMGLSIGVHLLNLLCIPAIVLVIYYKKNPNPDLKGSLLALLLSFGLIVLLLYGLVPGFVEAAGWFDLLFVNTFGLPYNSGVIFYFFLIIGLMSWALYESVVQKSEFRIRLSFILSISFMGILLIGDGFLLGTVLIIAMSIILFSIKKLPIRIINSTLLCLMVLFIGYSSYATILIRSCADTPMNQNAPDNPFDLGRYLNREQYGDRPLFYGYTFVSDVVRDSEGRPMKETGNAIYVKKVKTNASDKDEYTIAGYKEDYIYTPELNMLFPRMYSKQEGHVDAYKEWTNFKGKPMTVKQNGKNTTVYKPSFIENIKFFLSYQLYHMYWRYFMWNFSGRQNDIQGNGEVQNGNWITGFNFIDKIFVGDQSNLPPDMENNKAHNRYYLMPFILGIIGLLYQAYSGKKGIQGFWITFFLFFMTGIAIVIYLNQTPYQPRERDYAFAGSFYAYCIWIGLGVAALSKGLSRYMKPALAASIVTLICLIVPIQMGGQNWDDHDRSNRYVARDFGFNYLSCVEPNGIIFTNGDNDTFPLWYAQEVEGYRTDVRVCNLSYLQTEWYISQMKSPAYNSPSLPIDMKESQYSKGKLDFAYITNMTTQPIELNTAMDWLLSDDDRTKKIPGYEDRIEYIPSDQLFIPIDTAAVLKTGMIPESMRDKVVKQIDISYKSKNAVYKNEIAILDMLNVISKNNWDRPIYYAATVGSDMYMNLGNYFNLVGLAYRIIPVKGAQGGTVNTDLMYDNMLNKFKWGGIDNPKVYLDENTRRMCKTSRLMFVKLVDALLDEGKNEKALKAVNYCMKVIPGANVPHDYTSIMLGEDYFRLNHPKEATALLSEIANSSVANLRWYFTLYPSQLRTVMQSAGHDLAVLQNIIDLLNNNKQTELANKYIKEFTTYKTLWLSKQKKG